MRGRPKTSRSGLFQWRMRNIFMGGFIQWHMVSFVYGVCCLWRHKLTSYSCFQTNILAKFVDIICILFYTHTPYFVCRGTEYKLSALPVGILAEKLNATTQQFITANILGCALKQGSKTLSSLRQSNSQLQIETALTSCQIRAVEQRKCAAGLAGRKKQDRIMLKYTRIENAQKSTQENFPIFAMSSKLSVFLFPRWGIIKCLNASMQTTAVFELVQQFYHATEIGNVANAVSACADQP